MRDKLSSGIANSRLLSGNIRRKLQHSVLGRGEDLEALYLDNFYSAFSRAEQQQLLTVPFDGTYSSYLHYWNAQPNASLLRRMLYADQKTYLVELLMKQDQMSMACSIESRVPFLDHHLVEFAATVPDRMKLRGGVGKYILKRAVEDILPHDIVYRKKMGFPTPLRQWLMDPAADDLVTQLTDREGLLAPYIDVTYLENLLIRHKSGQEDATDRIWRLLNLQLWGNIFITSRTGILACPLP
jgi:asparagine synthase (glutamine-hydrolysing)